MGVDKEKEGYRFWLVLLLGLVVIFAVGTYLYLRLGRVGNISLPTQDRQATTQSYSIQAVKPANHFFNNMVWLLRYDYIISAKVDENTFY
jgi:hypothetical protein